MDPLERCSRCKSQMADSIIRGRNCEVMHMCDTYLLHQKRPIFHKLMQAGSTQESLECRQGIRLAPTINVAHRNPTFPKPPTPAVQRPSLDHTSREALSNGNIKKLQKQATCVILNFLVVQF